MSREWEFVLYFRGVGVGAEMTLSLERTEEYSCCLFNVQPEWCVVLRGGIGGSECLDGFKQWRGRRTMDCPRSIVYVVDLRDGG